MTLRVTTTTLSVAPRPISNARTTVGVGEFVTFTANRTAEWELPPAAARSANPPPSLEINVQITEAGRHTVTARSGRDSQRVELNVVNPSLQLLGSSFVEVPASYFGVHMQLSGVLTPRTVSFAQLQFRELRCTSTRTGYFRDRYEEFIPAHREVMNHIPTPTWADVDLQNRIGGVQGRDNAAIQYRVSDLPNPITQGTLQWRIPIEYKIVNQTSPSHSMGTVTQTFVIRPASRPQGPALNIQPFTGTISVNKGANEVRSTYRDGNLVNTGWVRRVLG